MNVVLQPALASLPALAGTDGPLCFEGACLFGWVWTCAALTLLSAWLVRCWPAGGAMARRLVPVGQSSSSSSSSTTVTATATSSSPGKAFAPRRAGTLAPRVRVASPIRSSGTADLAADCLALRAPPTTDMAADPVPNRTAGFSSPPLRPSRPTGTPTTSPEPSGAPPGQNPPA